MELIHGDFTYIFAEKESLERKKENKIINTILTNKNIKISEEQRQSIHNQLLQ